MMKGWLLWFLLFTPGYLQAQQTYTVSGTISNLPSATIYLLSYYGERTFMVDSVKTDPQGNFRFAMKPGAHIGQYRVGITKDSWVDFIFNKENIRLVTDAKAPVDSLRFIESQENRIYYDFMRMDAMNQARLELLQPVIDYYPVHDEFHQKASGEYEKIQQNQKTVLDTFALMYPASFAVRILKHNQPPFIPAALLPEDRLLYLRGHYFDHVDFNDTSLLHSTAWANKSIAYLSLYSNNRLPQKQLEAEFIKGVTVIMSAASVNAEIFKFLLDYLVGGFDKYHFEDVITYMAENFQDPFACEEADKKSALQKKLDTFKQIAIGKTAPGLEAPDIKGNLVKLAAVNSEYTLLVFYSTECTHCADMMPKVKAIYDTQKPKRIEIIAYSLDTDKLAWERFVKEEKLGWINISELKGFESKAADDYNIYATPTMFLLDSNKKILAKPISFRELEQTLRSMGL
jgi:thioredoxin-related protein